MSSHLSESRVVENAVLSAAISNPINFVLNLLTSLLAEELGLLVGFQAELEKLQRKFRRIQSVLEDAMTRELNERTLQDWIEKLTDVAHHAENVLDKFNFEALRRNTASHEGRLRKVRDFFSGNNQLKFRLLMAHRIKDLNEKIDSFAEEVSKFNLGQVASQRPAGDTNENDTHSFVSSTDCTGREKEKESVIGMLTDVGAIGAKIAVIAIVGVGGIGKTTLAQLVYNDSKVVRHFKLKIWICVSDNFVLSRILKSIIKSAATDEYNESYEYDQLQIKVRDILHRKRFLLVLDDVWNENPEKWEKLEILLRSGHRDSKVMITTRSQNISSIMGSSQNLLLGPLPYDICWDLFQRRAFKVGPRPSENLVEIGKDIVNKCCGIPLAAQALGSLLQHTREVVDWKEVKESAMWQLFNSNTGEINLMPVLKLSYDHLSPREKQCFVFSSLFPKDYEIEKETLILQWMSNGYVPNERAGHKVFNGLLWKSFFLEAKKDEDGLVSKCKLHDLMHDLAQSVAGMRFCMVTKDTGRDALNKRTYHLLIDQWTYNLDMLQKTKKAESLRTLLISNYSPIEKSLLHRTFFMLRCMRVLDLRSSGIKAIPESVGCLIHLRFLDMSTNPIKLLPKSICYLLNLQVLKLRNTKLEKLPETLRKLQSLRHFDIRGCLFLTNMPVGLERLTNLQTLSDFIVSKNKNSSTLKELKELNLSGELFIFHLENFITEATETEQTILSNKENLVSLRLNWYHRNNSAANNDNERVLYLLKPHKNLKRLQLNNYTGLRFPLWLSDSLLQSLVEVKLTYCTNCDHLPSFGSIPSLKDLQIIGMHEVRNIGGDFYGTGPVNGFPSLEKLAFFDMPKLQEWSVPEMMPFPQLSMLTVGRCQKLTSIPWGQSFQTLDLSHCSSSLLLASLPNSPDLSTLSFSQLIMLKMGRFRTSISIQWPWVQRLLTFLSRFCPSFVASLPNSPNLSALSSLVIDKVEGLTSLPDHSLLHLSSLRKLTVSSCMQLEHLSLNHMQLVKLQFLNIFDCPRLNSLSYNAKRLTCLQSLDIRNCMNLTSLPQNWTNITSLRSMNITNCLNITSSEGNTRSEGRESRSGLLIKGLNALSYFSLGICRDRTSSDGVTRPEGVGPGSWTEMVIRGLNTLSDFSLEICNNKVDLSGWLGNLTNLQTLTINGDHYNLHPKPGKYITGNYLMICCCGDRLGSLLQGMSTCSSLEDLTLIGISGTTLPDSIGDIQSLRNLSIRNCADIESLPNSLRGPARLDGLWIQGCPILKEWCQRNTGGDWSIISRVRSVENENITGNESGRQMSRFKDLVCTCCKCMTQ